MASGTLLSKIKDFGEIRNIRLFILPFRQFYNFRSDYTAGGAEGIWEPNNLYPSFFNRLFLGKKDEQINVHVKRTSKNVWGFFDYSRLFNVINAHNQNRYDFYCILKKDDETKTKFLNIFIFDIFFTDPDTTFKDKTFLRNEEFEIITSDFDPLAPRPVSFLIKKSKNLTDDNGDPISEPIEYYEFQHYRFQTCLHILSKFFNFDTIEQSGQKFFHINMSLKYIRMSTNSNNSELTAFYEERKNNEMLTTNDFLQFYVKHFFINNDGVSFIQKMVKYYNYLKDISRFHTTVDFSACFANLFMFPGYKIVDPENDIKMYLKKYISLLFESNDDLNTLNIEDLTKCNTEGSFDTIVGLNQRTQFDLIFLTLPNSAFLPPDYEGLSALPSETAEPVVVSEEITSQAVLEGTSSPVRDEPVETTMTQQVPEETPDFADLIFSADEGPIEPVVFESPERPESPITQTTEEIIIPFARYSEIFTQIQAYLMKKLADNVEFYKKKTPKLPESVVIPEEIVIESGSSTQDEIPLAASSTEEIVIPNVYESQDIQFLSDLLKKDTNQLEALRKRSKELDTEILRNIVEIEKLKLKIITDKKLSPLLKDKLTSKQTDLSSKNKELKKELEKLNSKITKTKRRQKIIVKQLKKLKKQKKQVTPIEPETVSVSEPEPIAVVTRFSDEQIEGFNAILMKYYLATNNLLRDQYQSNIAFLRETVKQHFSKTTVVTNP